MFVPSPNLPSALLGGESFSLSVFILSFEGQGREERALEEI